MGFRFLFRVCHSQSFNVRWSKKKSTKTEQRSKTLFFPFVFRSDSIQFSSSVWHFIVELKIKFTDNFLIAYCRLSERIPFDVFDSYLFFSSSSLFSICGRHFVFASYFTHFHLLAFIIICKLVQCKRN